MAVNHAGHDHPTTPAGRAACRKALANVIPGNPPIIVAKTQAQAKRTAKSLGKRMVEHAEPTSKKVKGDTEQAWRVPLTAIPDGSSLLGFPVYVSEVIRFAWRMEWRVDVGRVWNKEGGRSVKIGSYRGWLWISWHRDGPGVSSMVWQVDDVDARELTSMNEGIRLLKGE